MKFGLTLAPVEPLSQLVKYAQLAEDVGFENIWLSPVGPWFKDTIIYLTAIAAQTKKIGLGLMATTPFERHPGTLAAEMLTLNEISSGRARLGVAIGVFQKLKQLGVETKLRFTAMKETIEVVKKLSTGESVTYQGKFVQLNGLRFPWAKSFPVYVAGSSHRSLQLAGEIADGAIVAHFPPSYAKWANGEMCSAAEKNGRERKEVELLVQEMTVMMSDKEEALSRAKKVIIDPFRPRTVLFYLGPALWASKESRVFERSGFQPAEIEAIQREEKYLNSFEEGNVDPSRLDSVIPSALEDKICKTLAMIGNSKDCLEKIKAYEDAGVSEFMPGFWGYETRNESTIKGLEDYKKEIMPEFSH